MRLLKSKYFWLTILVFVLGFGTAFLLHTFAHFPGLYCYGIGGTFVIISVLILLLIRQRELTRRLSANSDLRDAKAEWDESWRKNLDTELDHIFNSLRNSKTKALASRKIYLTASETEQAFLQCMQSEAQVLEVLPAEPAAAMSAFFRWVVTTDAIFILIPQRLMLADELREVRYLVHRLGEKGGLKSLGGLVVHASGDPSKTLALQMQKTFRTILADSQLELPLYAMLDWAKEQVDSSSLLSDGKVLGKSFAFKRDELPSGTLKVGIPVIMDQARRVLLWRMGEQDVGQEQLRSGMKFLAVLESRLQTFASFLDVVAKPTLDREAAFLRSLLVFHSSAAQGEKAASQEDNIWGAAQFEDDTPSPATKPANEKIKASDGSFAWVIRRFAEEPFLTILPSYRQSQLSTKGLILAVLVTGFGLLISAGAIYSYSAGKLLESDWSKSYERIQANIHWENNTARVQSMPWADSLLQLMHTISDERPMALAPGFYRDSRVLNKTQALYTSLFGQLQQDAVRQRAAIFHEITSAAVPEKGKIYGQLKNYLLFTVDGHAQLSAENKDALADTVASLWLSALGISEQAREDQRNSIHLHAQQFTKAISQSMLPPDATDRQLVQQARSILQDAGNIEALYQQIISDVNAAFPPVGPTQLGLPKELGFNSAQQVLGAYTRAAYDSLVSKRLESVDALKGDWVMGAVDDNQSGTSAFELRSNLRTRYFQDYQSQWATFLTSITFAAPSEAHDLSMAMKNLAAPASKGGQGLRSFMTQVAVNLDYSDLGKLPSAAQNSLVKDVIKKVPGQLVNKLNGSINANPAQSMVDHFAFFFKIKQDIEKGGEDDFFKDMLVLKDVLDASSGESGAGKAFTFLAAGFAGDRDNSLNRLFLEADRLFRDLGTDDKAITNALYVTPLRNVATRLLDLTQQGLEKDYQEKILRPFQAMAVYFPFTKEAAKEIEPDVLKRLMSGKGSALADFMKSIEPFLDKGHAGGLYPKLWNENKLAFSPKSMEGLLRLQQLSDALFAGNAELAKSQIKISIPQNPRVSLSVQTAGKEWKVASGEADANGTFSWPNGGDDGFAVQAKTATNQFSEQESGQWSLLRELWKMGRPNGRNKCILDWRVKDKSYYIPVTIQFQFESSINPFVDQNFFHVELGHTLFGH